MNVCRNIIIGVIVGGSIASPMSSSLHAGPPSDCIVTESQLLRAPMSVSELNWFGRSIAADGDVAVVGSRANTAGVSTGAAVVLNRRNGLWEIGPQLPAPPLAEFDDFGVAVDVQGAVAAVGAPNRDIGATNTGAVFVFGFDGTAWSLQQTITAPDIQAGRVFGSAVALVDDLLVIGASGDHHGGFFFTGAIYLYRFNGAQWQFEEKLISTNSANNRRLGRVIDAQPDRIVTAAGASGNHHVQVMDRIGGAWATPQFIFCPEPLPPGNSSFGESISLDGDALAVGGRTLQQEGMAYVFARDGTGAWTLERRFEPPPMTPEVPFVRFGRAVALRGSTLVITAEEMSQTYPLGDDTWVSDNAGGAFVYDRAGGAWPLRHHLRRAFIDNSSEIPPSVSDLVGSSAAIAGDDILIGAVELENAVVPTATTYGAVLMFDVEPPDCDGNGVADVCDLDCNHNLTPDACDIATLASGDCDANGQPDECQASHDYSLDSGIGNGVWGPGGGGDYIWLNQFNVSEGSERLTHIVIPWTGFTPHGTPVTLLVYDDPNNDGDPHDAVLLSTSPATATDRFGLSNIPTFTIHPITPTVVGEAGDSFFIGAYVQCLPDVYVAAADNAPALQRSWRALNLFGQGDIVTLTNNPTFGNSSANYQIRGLALDCNGNGTWDDCDINSGASLDANRNGIPDECEGPTCIADLAPIGPPQGDGTVNVQDLLAVIGAWGACVNPNSCPADIAPAPSGDEVVNVQDLLAVIGAWGACS